MISKLLEPYKEYIRLAVGVLSLATIISLGLYVKYLQHEVATGREAKTEVAAVKAANKVYIAGTQKVTAKRQEALHEVDEVRHDYPAWADEPLPDDAADILRAPAAVPAN